MIRFQNVSFAYEKEEKILHSVNLELHPGASAWDCADGFAIFQ